MSDEDLISLRDRLDATLQAIRTEKISFPQRSGAQIVKGDIDRSPKSVRARHNIGIASFWDCTKCRSQNLGETVEEIQQGK